MLQENQVYYITNKTNGLSIDSTDPVVCLRPFSSDASQKFFFEKEKGLYVITNQTSEQVLQVSGDLPAATISRDDFNGTQNEMWKVEAIPGAPVGQYLISLSESGLYLACQPDNSLRLVDQKAQAQTVWQLHPIDDSQ